MHIFWIFVHKFCIFFRTSHIWTLLHIFHNLTHFEHLLIFAFSLAYLQPCMHICSIFHSECSKRLQSCKRSRRSPGLSSSLRPQLSQIADTADRHSCDKYMLNFHCFHFFYKSLMHCNPKMENTQDVLCWISLEKIILFPSYLFLSTTENNPKLGINLLNRTTINYLSSKALRFRLTLSCLTSSSKTSLL